jgi:hypothetical protein
MGVPILRLGGILLGDLDYGAALAFIPFTGRWDGAI